MHNLVTAKSGEMGEELEKGGEMDVETLVVVGMSPIAVVAVVAPLPGGGFVVGVGGVVY